MFVKNLLRRKIRTLLTIFGIAIGVTAIVALGAMADNMEVGYSSMLTGSKADLVISQPDAFDPTFSAVDEAVGREIAAMPEIAEASGMLQGYANAENEPFIFVFGYPADSFILGRFRISAGTGLDSREAQTAHGKPALLGSAAAEVMKKSVGDTLRVMGSVFRVVGIYETGDSFEDSGLVIELADAQELLGKSRQVSLLYIRLKDPALRERFTLRFERQYPKLELSGSKEFADKQKMQDYLRAMVWVIGGLAIVIGGIGMMNAQLMAVMERTREIGTLRAIGWSKSRVLWMILAESLSVSLLGGALGATLGYGLLYSLSKFTVIMGVTGARVKPELIVQAFLVVFILGVVGGLYPAWRASRMLPSEALRYEGGSGGKVHRLPVGGMALQSLWQRSGRTLLTISAIAISVGAIMAMEGMIRGFMVSFSDVIGKSAEIMIRQSNISDTEFSVLDERIGERLTNYAEIKAVSGIIFTAVVDSSTGGIFILWGYAPNEFAIQRFKIVEGQALATNHQILLGRMMASTLKRKVGDTVELNGIRFRVVGIYESSAVWEELGGVATLRDAQVFTGRPRKVGMYAIRLHDPDQAPELVERINREYPEAYATLAGEFVEQMPDMKSVDGILGGISALSILIGGVGVLNTMLMAVFERTREIGVLRALGWRRRSILGLILQESLLLGVLGGALGILVAFGMIALAQQEKSIGGFYQPLWQIDIFVRALSIALILGILGGLYPALRATRLQPIEALRYE